MATRQELIDTYTRMRAELKQTLDGLSDLQMQERTLGEWSVKDILAHIVAWDELRAFDIERVTAGGMSPHHDITDEQDEAINQLTAELRRDLPLDQVRWEFDYTRHRVIEAIERAPEAALDPASYGRAPLLSTHDEAHAEQIREWRRQHGI